MKRIRAVEETIASRYTEWKMRCPVHLCTGQEAVSVGVSAVLHADDLAVSTHRSHGHYLSKGGDLKRMIAELFGKETGCSSGRGGSMHLIDERVGFMGSTSIVGGTIPIGTGLGFSILRNGTPQISCVYLGDGAVEEGVFYESVNFAALMQLPVLYICENNLYSVYSPLDVRQPSDRNIAHMVNAWGIKSDSGDGNNVVEVYKKVSLAAEHIRGGKGPYFIEFSTYRWREHCGPNFDNDIGYRSVTEFENWKKKDPIDLLESQLLKQGYLVKQDVTSMDTAIQKEIEEAFEYAESSPFPASTDAGKYVYAD
ncbi:thiamine pyrophosphate-dependent dehydrogenase E1 component subunit alpha [Acidaminobacter sp.]|uniref:thiamine pyrophosphate-dependent dehydrogenase E1 component subunit alpha n=1 Tax=Acidaminobacter sp. TaxID=1872102 RepID=UPI002561663E|nr:thiamine pyrophosphate-dependent dehydrogenase E1 component subunit alpha [Acidaminobacter sp.]MDK9712468.1 thiamine pyrophosphate-dependent dehydrogenase E1 component subunit alpha [Acidaminobacter sp.]